MYTAIYLPVSQLLEDGDIVINSQGEHFVWNISLDMPQETVRPAILFLVHKVFNEQLIVGIPEPRNGWLKAGMTVKESDCEKIPGMFERVVCSESGEELNVPLISVKCPVCGGVCRH